MCSHLNIADLRTTGRLALAGSGAAIVGHNVTIVALLGRFHFAIATDLLGLARGRATVARKDVAVITGLAGLCDVVAANGHAATWARLTIGRVAAQSGA